MNMGRRRRKQRAPWRHYKNNNSATPSKQVGVSDGNRDVPGENDSKRLGEEDESFFADDVSGARSTISPETSSRDTSELRGDYRVYENIENSSVPPVGKISSFLSVEDVQPSVHAKKDAETECSAHISDQRETPHSQESLSQETGYHSSDEASESLGTCDKFIYGATHASPKACTSEKEIAQTFPKNDENTISPQIDKLDDLLRSAEQANVTSSGKTSLKSLSQPSSSSQQTPEKIPEQIFEGSIESFNLEPKREILEELAESSSEEYLSAKSVGHVNEVLTGSISTKLSDSSSKLSKQVYANDNTISTEIDQQGDLLRSAEEMCVKSSVKVTLESLSQSSSRSHQTWAKMSEPIFEGSVKSSNLNPKHQFREDIAESTEDGAKRSLIEVIPVSSRDTTQNLATESVKYVYEELSEDISTGLSDSSTDLSEQVYANVENTISPQINKLDDLLRSVQQAGVTSEKVPLETSHMTLGEIYEESVKSFHTEPTQQALEELVESSECSETSLIEVIPVISSVPSADTTRNLSTTSVKHIGERLSESNGLSDSSTGSAEWVYAKAPQKEALQQSIADYLKQCPSASLQQISEKEMHVREERSYSIASPAPEETHSNQELAKHRNHVLADQGNIQIPNGRNHNQVPDDVSFAAADPISQSSTSTMADTFSELDQKAFREWTNKNDVCTKHLVRLLDDVRCTDSLFRQMKQQMIRMSLKSKLMKGKTSWLGSLFGGVSSIISDGGFAALSSMHVLLTTLNRCRLVHILKNQYMEDKNLYRNFPSSVNQCHHIKDQIEKITETTITGVLDNALDTMGVKELHNTNSLISMKFVEGLCNILETLPGSAASTEIAESIRKFLSYNRPVVEMYMGTTKSLYGAFDLLKNRVWNTLTCKRPHMKSKLIDLMLIRQDCLYLSQLQNAESQSRIDIQIDEALKAIRLENESINTMMTKLQ